MKRIATAEIDRPTAMDHYMSFKRLYATRANPHGPLQRIIAWFKNEDAMSFDTSHMKLGRDGDDFVVMYYYESTRWKIGKDGRAFVSSADADNMMEKEEADLQLLIDTILCDEITRTLAKLWKDGGNVRCGKVKNPDDQDGYHTKAFMGIQG